MKSFIKAETVTGCSVNDNIYPGDMEYIIDAKEVTNTSVARNRPDQSRLDDALKQIQAIIERSVLNELERNRIHAKVGQLKQEKSSPAKIERYKELLEMIKLHTDVLGPVLPHLQQWIGHAHSAIQSIT